MSRHFGLGLLVALLVLVGCTAHKRCDGPNGNCCESHPWWSKLFGKNQEPNYPIGAPPAGMVAQPPPGAVVVPGPGGAYNPPNLQGGTGFGPTPDMTAPPMPPGGNR